MKSNILTIQCFFTIYSLLQIQNSNVNLTCKDADVNMEGGTCATCFKSRNHKITNTESRKHYRIYFRKLIWLQHTDLNHKSVYLYKYDDDYLFIRSSSYKVFVVYCITEKQKQEEHQNFTIYFDDFSDFSRKAEYITDIMKQWQCVVIFLFTLLWGKWYH